MKSENYYFKEMAKRFSNLKIGWAVLSITAKGVCVKAKIDRIIAQTTSGWQKYHEVKRHLLITHLTYLSNAYYVPGSFSGVGDPVIRKARQTWNHRKITRKDKIYIVSHLKTKCLPHSGRLAYM